MSSWKKASKTNQKTHRERHQPEGRRHLGLLEKKKDYKLRADNQHEKQETLKLLWKKSLNKNPDEFYHHMINSKSVNGKHHEDEIDQTTDEQKKLMYSQDAKYIAMKRTIETKKLKRLQSQYHMIDAVNKVKNKHTFFVDSEEDLKNFDVAKHLDTHPALLDRKTNRQRLNTLQNMSIPDIDEEKLKAMSATREHLYNEIKNRIEREKELTVVQHNIELKKTLQEKRKLQPVIEQEGTSETAPVYKFKYERKK